MIRGTSREAYASLDHLGARQRAVYNAIASMGEACNLDIAARIGQPINAVTPRTNELVKAGLVEASRKDITPRTGKRVIFWRLKTLNRNRPVFGDAGWILRARQGGDHARAHP